MYNAPGAGSSSDLGKPPLEACETLSGRMEYQHLDRTGEDDDVADPLKPAGGLFEIDEHSHNTSVPADR